MRCKPGDLAWITACPGTPENIGLLVYVTARSAETLMGLEWFVESQGRAIVGWFEGKPGTGPAAFCPDRWLTPHRPGPVSLEVESEAML